jgi:hypothetical protein
MTLVDEVTLRQAVQVVIARRFLQPNAKDDAKEVLQDLEKEIRRQKAKRAPLLANM